MAKDKSHVYSIDLDIKSTANSKEVLNQLQKAYDDSNKSMSALNDTYAEIAKHTSDVTEAEKQYTKVVSKRLAEKDKEIELLQNEKIAIMANKDLTEKQKKEAIALKNAEIERLEADKKFIRAKEKEAKLLVKMNKLFHTNLNENSKAFKLAKATANVQEKLNKLLGKESKLRKAAAKAAQAGAKVGKVGLKAIGAGAAMGGALIGGAMAGAESIAEKERAVGSLKSGIDPSVVDSVYVKSGADYQTIVAAINNLSSITKDSSQLVQGAVLEIQNPGIGKLLLSQSNLNSSNISKLGNAISQIKQQTGIQDLSNAISASMQSSSVTRGAVSQTEYLQAYAALSQMGLAEENINRIINNVASKGGNFLETLNKTNLSQFVRGQDKNLVANQALNLTKLDTSKSAEQTSAQSITEKLREFELKKNELLIKMLPVVDKVLETVSKAIEGPTIDKIANGLVKLFTVVLPLLEPILKLLEPILDTLSPVVDWLSEVASDLVGKIITPLIKALSNLLGKIFPAFDKYGTEKEGAGSVSDIAKIAAAGTRASGGSRAQGGLVTSPAIVGEAGPELVIPLDYSRSGRAASIINNFNTTQSFNMAANQQTPLAFSQAVGQNKFIQRVNK